MLEWTFVYCQGLCFGARKMIDLLFSDEGGGSSDPHTDSSEDEVTEHVTRSTPANMAAARAQVKSLNSRSNAQLW